MKAFFRILLIALLALQGTAHAGGHEDSGPSLYERLGGAAGIEQIVADTIALHLENEAIAHYFNGVDLDQLAAHVGAFFAAGTGGPNNYQGRDMTTTHAHMHMSDADFDAAVADVLTAVESNDVDAAATAEVAAILESLRPAVMGTASE